MTQVLYVNIRSVCKHECKHDHLSYDKSFSKTYIFLFFLSLGGKEMDMYLNSFIEKRDSF